MREKLVLDTGVLSLHFVDAPAVRKYFDAITSGRSLGLVSSVNLAEFYFRTCKTLGKEAADARYFWLSRCELDVVDRNDVVRQAGLEKCRQSSMLSLADCFALALAKLEGALLVTTDSLLAKAAGSQGRHVAADMS